MKNKETKSRIYDVTSNSLSSATATSCAVYFMYFSEFLVKFVFTNLVLNISYCGTILSLFSDFITCLSLASGMAYDFCTRHSSSRPELKFCQIFKYDSMNVVSYHRFHLISIPISIQKTRSRRVQGELMVVSDRVPSYSDTFGFLVRNLVMLISCPYCGMYQQQDCLQGCHKLNSVRIK